MHIYFDWETSWKDKKKRQEMGDKIETGIIEISFEDTTWTVRDGSKCRFFPLTVKKRHKTVLI